MQTNSIIISLPYLYLYICTTIVSLVQNHNSVVHYSHGRRLVTSHWPVPIGAAAELHHSFKETLKIN